MEIEEMANEIYIILMLEADCSLSGEDCSIIADLLANKGYCKQSEGKWKQAYNNYPRYVYTNCNHLFNNKTFKYCPNCGAKMKGGTEE